VNTPSRAAITGHVAARERQADQRDVNRRAAGDVEDVEAVVSSFHAVVAVARVDLQTGRKHGPRGRPECNRVHYLL
jgi:hypothetical protein